MVSNDWMDKKFANSWLSDIERNLLYSHWAANGYVAVDPSNKNYWKDYNNISIEVHGWLTYGKHLSKVWSLIKKAYLELPGTSEDDDVWIYGFDTNHYWDNRSIERVEKETNYLAEQFN